MNGLISRQAAIDAIEITPFDDYGDYMRSRELIEQLPSAQPQTCDDAISREDAKWVVLCNRDHVEDQANAIDSLPCVLPSAQPEIIRCKDCEHCADDWNGNQPIFTCELGSCGESVMPNDFCSRAERR